MDGILDDLSRCWVSAIGDVYPQLKCQSTDTIRSHHRRIMMTHDARQPWSVRLGSVASGMSLGFIDGDFGRGPVLVLIERLFS